jgi:hypothetical protein
MAENKYRKARAEMADMGRNGDTVLGHLSRGEMVVPNELLDAEDGALRKILEGVMKEVGINPNQFTVGHEDNKINPATGLPEFGWLSKAFKAVKSVVKSVVKTVKSVVGTVKSVVGGVASAVGLSSPKPTVSTAQAPSTAAAPSKLEEDAAQKKSTLLKRKRRGRRGLRIDSGNASLGGAGDGTGVGTGGSSGGSSVNVPKG